ncbi:MAG: hypothetical protein PHY47_14495 [Lachnospiraceae bacterium]|nr:hypothetical protein [Lachnospiraceae bacterium]
MISIIIIIALGSYLINRVNREKHKVAMEYTIDTEKMQGMEDALIILSLDMKQIDINNRNYLRFNTEDGNISSGILQIRAPEEPGLYDVTGWIVREPFSGHAQFVNLDAAFRFTLNVEMVREH